MRDKDGNVEIVETPEEFLDKFVGCSWEYDYIKEEERELLEGWIADYIILKKYWRDVKWLTEKSLQY